MERERWIARYTISMERRSTGSSQPYAFAGDDAGAYRKWTPTLGSHTLRAVPYSDSSGGGAVGIPLEVTFTVVESAPVAVEPAPPPFWTPS